MHIIQYGVHMSMNMQSACTKVHVLLTSHLTGAQRNASLHRLLVPGSGPYTGDDSTNKEYYK